MVFDHSRLAIRHSPIHTGAFLTGLGGLYDGSRVAKVAATAEAVKRRGPDINAEHS